jgi:hypothetical protein
MEMEVYLSEEVLESLSALRLDLSDANTDGFLIGHRRAHMFFVERIFPSRRGFFSSEKIFLSLIKLLHYRILGFYSFLADQKKTNKLLSPFFYGKLFLSIEINKKNQLVIKPFVIEHEKDFFLSPIKIKSNRQRKEQWIIP